MSTARQVVRFGVVGVLNTGVYYGCYLALRLVMPYIAAHLIAWVISMLGSFLLNCYFTYKVRPTWHKLLLYPLSNGVNVLLTTGGVVFLVEVMKVDQKIAPLIAGILAIPATFVVTRAVLTRPHGQRKPVEARPISTAPSAPRSGAGGTRA